MRLPTKTQTSRRALQILVLLLMVVTPILARYGNYLSARQLDKMVERFDGSFQGKALVWTDGTLRLLAPDKHYGEDVVRRDRKRVLEAAASLKGSTWSFELFGLSLTDPLAVLESALTSKALPWVLLSGALIPLIFTILLGRIFCSWICPIGFLLELSGKLRAVLRFLEIRPGRIRLWPGDKFLILGLGLATAVFFGLPFLGYLYPPALLGREIHNGVTVMFDRAEEGLLGFSAAGLTLASWFLLGIGIVEILFGPRLWCRALCPGGAVYAALGKFRLIRVKRNADLCTDCAECIPVCEMGLNPMRDHTGIECDNCGVCISHCPDGALRYEFSLSDEPRRSSAGNAPLCRKEAV